MQRAPQSFQKRSITFKNAWLPLILCYEKEVGSLFNTDVISFWLPAKAV